MLKAQASLESPRINEGKMLRRLFDHPFINILLCLIFANLIILLYVDILLSRGIPGELGDEISKAEEFLQTGRLNLNTFYPPGIYLFLAVLKIVGIEFQNSIDVNIALLNVSVCILVVLVRLELRCTWARYACMLALVANPYLLWTGLAQRDVAAELLLFSLFMLILRMSIIGEGKNGWAWTACLIPVMLYLPMVRLTEFFVIPLILITVIFMFGRKNILILSKSALLFLVFVSFSAIYMNHNKNKTGDFTIGHSSGINMFLGNHPNYLHAHPNYDLDTFMGPQLEAYLIQHAGSGERTQAEEAAIYKDLAVKEIVENPVNFLYNIIMKSYRHWFNITKIPAYTTYTSLDEKNNVIIIRETSTLTSLVYSLYKLAYMPVFIILLGWVFWLRKRWELLYLLPHIALWPIVVLTFPDTRFKIVAEAIAVIPMFIMIEAEGFTFVQRFRERLAAWLRS